MELPMSDARRTLKVYTRVAVRKRCLTTVVRDLQTPRGRGQWNVTWARSELCGMRGELDSVGLD